MKTFIFIVVCQIKIIIIEIEMSRINNSGLDFDTDPYFDVAASQDDLLQEGATMNTQNVLFKKYKPEFKKPSLLNLRVLLSYVISDLRRKPTSYQIGIFTIALVITFTVMIWSAVGYTSLVFLKIA